MDVHDRLLLLIGEIYGAVGDPARWTRCLASICDLLQGTGANLMHHDHRDHRGGVSASVTDPAALDAYARYFHTVDPWALALQPAALAPGAIVSGTSLVPHADLKKTEDYADLGEPFGLTRTLIGIIDVLDGGVIAAVTVNRDDASGEFDAESVRLLGALVPHLRRALALHQQLAAVAAEQAALIGVLDHVRTAVALVDADLALVTANRAADRLLSRNDGLRLDGRRIHAATPEITAALLAALAAASAVARGERVEAGRSRVTLPKSSGGRPLEASVVPLIASPPAGPLHPIAAVLIVDPDEVPAVPDAVLAERYGLTPAETRVAKALAAGDTVRSIAESLRLTQDTTRWYVKQVLAKTGTSRQAQLVHLLLSAFAGLPFLE
jgi:DNA-binding CsgD family transcriptional regulator